MIHCPLSLKSIYTTSSSKNVFININTKWSERKYMIVTFNMLPKMSPFWWSVWKYLKQLIFLWNTKMWKWHISTQATHITWFMIKQPCMATSTCTWSRQMKFYHSYRILKILSTIMSFPKSILQLYIIKKILHFI